MTPADSGATAERHWQYDVTDSTALSAAAYAFPSVLGGALVLDGSKIDAVAVRRRRRGQGIGTALVEAASDRRGRVTAAFDADVRPFYEALGFAIQPLSESDRYRGVRE